MAEYSISPTGEKFQLPSPEDYPKEFERLNELVEHQRSLGREIVVVMGLENIWGRPLNYNFPNRKFIG